MSADLHEYRRGQGRARRFDSSLPRVPVSARTRIEFEAMAEAGGLSLADAMREAITNYLGHPAEEPNPDQLED